MIKKKMEIGLPSPHSACNGMRGHCLGVDPMSAVGNSDDMEGTNKDHVGVAVVSVGIVLVFSRVGLFNVKQ